MTDVLASTAGHLGAEIARAQRDARLPSLVAAVLRDGRVVWHGSRGRVAATDAEPTPQTQYRIGSISKTMTAALVLQLRDQGHLDLADPLSRHLPDAPMGERTVRELLSHGSGMQAEPDGSWWERSPGVAWSELAATHRAVSGVLSPGQRHHYSNLGYAVLGELVARVRGCIWWDTLEADLAQPLGLQRTTYHPQAPHASGFSVDAFTDRLTPEPAHDARSMAPAGQLWSTVGDLCRWLGVLLRPDGVVLTEASAAEMAIPQVGQHGDAGGYGLGVRLSRSGDRLLVGHTGSMPGFVAGMFGDPDTGVGAVVLANGTSGLDLEGLPHALIETLLHEEPVWAPEWVPPRTVDPLLAELSGLWHWGNTAMTARVEGGRLRLATLSGGRKSSFEPAGADTLVGLDGYHTGETMRVLRRADGTISHLDLATFVLTRVPYDPRSPVPGGHPG